MVSPATCRECGGRGYHTIDNPCELSNEIEKLRALHKAVEHNLDWQNGVDLSADYEAKFPEEYAALNAALEAINKPPKGNSDA